MRGFRLAAMTSSPCVSDCCRVGRPRAFPAPALAILALLLLGPACTPERGRTTVTMDAGVPDAGDTPDAALPSTQPLGWDEGIRMPDAEDVNPDPAIVEVELEARVQPLPLADGGMLEMWTYNGLVPGPYLRAQG